MFSLKEYDELICSPILGDETTADEIGCIEEAIEHGKAYDYNLSDVQHKHFIVDKFYPTNFRKATKNLILKSKIFICQKCPVMKKCHPLSRTHTILVAKHEKNSNISISENYKEMVRE